MTQLFLSYSRVDIAFVEQLYARLQRMFPDFKLWYDKSPHGLLGGDNWWQSILTAIDESDIFIYILSNESVNSIYCQAEFAEARRLQKRIITIQARDRTEIPDSLGDIQFIDMKNGVADHDASDQLVASINRQLKLVKKSRALWKPATTRPGKETQPARVTNTPHVDTPPLQVPAQEAGATPAKKSEDGNIRGTVIGALLAGIFTIVAASIAILPSLLDRGDNAATQAALNSTQTQAALAITLSPTTPDTDTPAPPSETPTITNTPEPTSTPTATLPIANVVMTLDYQATEQLATVFEGQTAAARATEYAVGTLSIINQTATATRWTHTPTPNMTASIDAYRTQQGDTATAQFIAQMTATAASWTDTPTATLTPTNTQTPSVTPTATPTVSAEQIGATPVTQNAAWTPIERDFDGVTMVLVPAGCFGMGNDPNITYWNGDQWVTGVPDGGEQCFETPFWIDKYEVTQAQFARLGGIKTGPNAFPGDSLPIENVKWSEARDFCALRKAYLPTEREWEYAASGPDHLKYPWGNTWDTKNAIWNRSDGPVDVGSFPMGASWIGTLDMIGSVWEWTGSVYAVYPYNGSDGREADTAENTNRAHVARGGSWFTDYSEALRSTIRYNGASIINIGFRCARPIGDSPAIASAALPLSTTVPLPDSITQNADWAPVEQDFDGVTMVLVPAGCFQMGSEEGRDDEKPVHQQCFDVPFWVDKYEVTNEQFASFNGVAAKSGYWLEAKRPRENITWIEARNFCTLRGVRLPTEREWEYAARGPDNLVYPWGNEWNENNVVWSGNSYDQTAEVGSRPDGKSWVNAQDMVGNVGEWVNTQYRSYPYDVSLETPQEIPELVLRGSSALHEEPSDFRAAIRYRNNNYTPYGVIGFRCARSVNASSSSSSTPAPTIETAIAFTPVTQNADWTPVEQDFGGVTMVLVPAGCFQMGSENDQADEKPVHEQCFDNPFWIDKYEVTNGQFTRFTSKIIVGEKDLPRISITWFEAYIFCSLRGASLPTEKEWEYAARGPDSLTYPWGNEWDGKNAVWAEDSIAQTAAIGTRPSGASWVGAQDLIGGVWEWMHSTYSAYPYDGLDGRESNDSSLDSRVYRGGAGTVSYLNFLRAAYRTFGDKASQDIGFRCVRAIDASSAVNTQITVTVVPTREDEIVVPATETPIAKNADWTPVEQDVNGVTMVLVPAGCFQMGSEQQTDEQPIHQQCFDTPFWIDRDEVTNAQFNALNGFAINGSYWSNDDHPREQVSWFEAREFCARHGARLPTEAEWEYAARGPDNLMYPWGNAFSDNNENLVWATNASGQTAAVGSHFNGVSWVGAQDMAGNVWEWTSSAYVPYPYSAIDGREDNPEATDIKRALRGGSWINENPIDFHAAIRGAFLPDVVGYNIGFRCAWSE